MKDAYLFDFVTAINDVANELDGHVMRLCVPVSGYSGVSVRIHALLLVITSQIVRIASEHATGDVVGAHHGRGIFDMLALLDNGLEQSLAFWILERLGVCWQDSSIRALTSCA